VTAWIAALRPSDEQRFLGIAVFSALLSGLAVIGFRLAIEGIRLALLGPELVAHRLSLIVVPVAVGVIVAFLMVRIFPTMGGSGVNQTKAAVYIQDGVTPLRAAVGKFITASLAIGGGQSLGPEDPSLHIGAAIGSFLGTKAGLSRDRRRQVAPIGAAAGLAAAFNAPVSAVLFVVEEITGTWSASMLCGVILAASTGVVIADWLLGGGPLFHLPAGAIARPAELPAWASIGVVGGIVSVLFSRLLVCLRSQLRALPRWTRYGQPALAGLAIGVVAYVGAPQVMGAGYETVDRAIADQFAWQMLAALAALKILATTLSIATGTPGGLFAPTLFIGAMVGGAVGGAEHVLCPAIVPATGTTALLGMSALFAGFLRAPLTSIFMVVEVSGNYSIAVPAMVASTLAYLISHKFQPTAIFDLLGRQDGLQLPSMEQERDATILLVENAMRAPPARHLWATQTVREALETLGAVTDEHILVHDAAAGWRLLNGPVLRALADRGEHDLRVGVLCRRDELPRVYPDHALNSAMHHVHEWPLVPVGHRADDARLQGILTLEAVLSAYAANAAGPDVRPPFRAGC
jgi:CIC family chloride channel protein